MSKKLEKCKLCNGTKEVLTGFDTPIGKPFKGNYKPCPKCTKKK